MKIIVSPYSSAFLNNLMFDCASPFNTENRRVPDYKFMLACKQKGWEIGTCDMFNNINKNDIYLAFNHSETNYSAYGRHVRYENRILIALEPFLKNNWSNTIQKHYSKILTWNENIIDNKKVFNIFVPITKEKVNWVPIEERLFLTNISIFKKVNHQNELYSERVKTIILAEKIFLNNFDFFGIGWNKPKSLFQKLKLKPYNYFSSYRGAVINKFEILKKYTFSLCYENIQNTNGYLSEKIFDCFQCGVIPLYWGDPKITSKIPKNSYILRTDFSCNREMLEYIKDLNSNEICNYLKNIKLFLESEKMNIFSDDYYVKQLVFHISSLARTAL